jgi:hypothetical protein
MAMSDIHGETSRKMLFPLFSRSINSNISTRTKKLIFVFFQIKKEGWNKQNKAEQSQYSTIKSAVAVALPNEFPHSIRISIKESIEH